MILAKPDTKETKDRVRKYRYEGHKRDRKKGTTQLVLLKRTHRADKKPIITTSREPRFNYLKYWCIVRKWARTKYDLSSADLDILLFLYDEPIFKKSHFMQCEEIHTWESGRLKRYMERGWIRIFREGKGYKNRAKLYEVTPKAKRIVQELYLKLAGQDIPENKQNNPMYLAKNKSAGMNYYKKAIRLMNERRRKEREVNGDYDI